MRVARYEPFAWWLTREQIGRDLRERYAAAQELSPRLLKIVRKLDGAEGNQELSPSFPALFGKLDALEGSQLLRAGRKRLRRDAKRKRYFRKDARRSRQLRSPS